MAYVLGGSSNEQDGFTATIANFALQAVHESTGLVNYTTVVAPNQGNQYLIPLFAPITFADYNEAGVGGTTGFGNADWQNPALDQSSITATPAVATTAFGVFYDATTSFQLAATLGSEIGASFAEKVDQRVAAAFTGFKATPGNNLYAPTPVDGFARPTQLGAMELRVAGGTGGTPTAGFTSNTVLGLVRNVKQNWKASRLPGSPTIVLDSNGQSNGTGTGGAGSSMIRLLAELTGGAVNNNVSDLGNELLTTGQIENVYGCRVLFTTFLPTDSRSISGGAPENCLVGAYIADGAMTTVMKRGLEIKMGEMPTGLQMFLTGIGYFGAGVSDPRRGGAINVEQSL